MANTNYKVVLGDAAQALLLQHRPTSTVEGILTELINDELKRLQAIADAANTPSTPPPAVEVVK